MPSLHLSRRQLIGSSMAGAGAVLLGTGAWNASASYAAPPRLGNPFTLGVASGDPRHDGVVLWTRLAPDAFAVDGHGGMPTQPVRVAYEVARDEHFRSIARRGTVVATPELGHSVHPELSGLAPDSEYYYRFRVGTHISPVGRTRTTPHPRSQPRNLRFAFASCQAWQDGYYTAYDHMAREDLDLVVHLGDYLYESGVKTNKRGVVTDPRFHTETVGLDRYRLQYALYKSESPLQAAHAAFPWIHTMDDHEVDNNWAADVPQDQDPGQLNDTVEHFRQRRTNAFQAMYEHLPLRRTQMPSGPDVRLHRRLPYGRLADITMLDTRQYRSNQPCGDGGGVDCDDRFNPDQTMLGGKQKDWLLDGFSSSPARWQVIGNQAPMMQTDRNPEPGVTDVWYDPWDGYVAERNDVLGAAQDRGVRNLVVITGDRHQNYAGNLHRSYQDAGSPVVGSEFVGTSITSSGNGEDVGDAGTKLLAANPHLKFFNGQRGYVRCEVTRYTWTSDYRVLDRVTTQGGSISTRASVVVEDRKAGVEIA